MTETQDSITEWARETFGPAHFEQLVARLNEEVAELITAALSEKTSWSDVAAECADVYIMLAQVASYCYRDLGAAVDLKMKINRARVWATDGKGTGQHV
jgi:NTP pyrophosphatase (non-canonical NTP hydrolase)